MEPDALLTVADEPDRTIVWTMLPAADDAAVEIPAI
jgi:hypothetical protein